MNPKKEFTPLAVMIGMVLSVVMGAANVYLGLRAGMSVSASIPAAVVAMGIYNGLLKRKSLLEANMVQTCASAGESLAAGIIFTMPAMLLAGIWTSFDFWTTSLIALGGGMLGVLFMIPMRKVFVINSPELKYPEGLACAEVLKSGEAEEGSGVSGTKLIFGGLLVGGLFKVLLSFFGLFKHTVEWAVYQSQRVFYFGFDVSPALVSVGVIVGLPIACQIFMGGVIGWIFIMPFIPLTEAPEAALDGAWKIWSTQVRYVGVGAMVVGGIVSIWRVRAGLAAAVTELASRFRATSGGNGAISTEDVSTKTIIAMAVVSVIIIMGVYFQLLNHHIGITLLVTVPMIVLAFFLTAIASYIVGLVGNSNSPVSGMTISAILITGALIHLFGYSGVEGIVATLGVAGVVCCAACTSGDVCNDLKTGSLVGATPRSQQKIQMLGVLSAAFIMAPVLEVLHQGSLNNGTGGIGGKALPAPQAGLFASLVNAFFRDGELPWDMVGYGAAIAVLMLVADTMLEKNKSSFRLHIMPVAVGIYLPFGLSVSIMLGGLLSYFIKGNTNEETDRMQKSGILVASGLIAGESLIGVLLGCLAYMQIRSFHIGESLGSVTGDIISIIALAAICWWVYRSAKRAGIDN